MSMSNPLSDVELSDMSRRSSVSQGGGVEPSSGEQPLLTRELTRSESSANELGLARIIGGNLATSDSSPASFNNSSRGGQGTGLEIHGLTEAEEVQEREEEDKYRGNPPANASDYVREETDGILETGAPQKKYEIDQGPKDLEDLKGEAALGLEAGDQPIPRDHKVVPLTGEVSKLVDDAANEVAKPLTDGKSQDHVNTIRDKIYAKYEAMEKKSGLAPRWFAVLFVAAIIMVVAILLLGNVFSLAIFGAVGAFAIMGNVGLLTTGILLTYVAVRKLGVIHGAYARFKEDKNTYERMQLACENGEFKGSYLTWVKSIREGYTKVKEFHVRRDFNEITYDLQLFKKWEKESKLFEKLKKKLIDKEKYSPEKAEEEARIEEKDQQAKLTLEKQEFLFKYYGLLPTQDTRDNARIEKALKPDSNYRTWLKTLSDDPAFTDILKDKENADLLEKDLKFYRMWEKHTLTEKASDPNLNLLQNVLKKRECDRKLNVWKGKKFNEAHSKKTLEQLKAEIPGDLAEIQEYLSEQCKEIAKDKKEALDRDVEEMNDELYEKVVETDISGVKPLVNEALGNKTALRKKKTTSNSDYMKWAKSKILDQVRLDPAVGATLDDKEKEACKNELLKDEKFVHQVCKDVELYRLWRTQDALQLPPNFGPVTLKNTTSAKDTLQKKLIHYRDVTGDLRSVEEIEADIKEKTAEFPIALQAKFDPASNAKLKALIDKAEAEAEADKAAKAAALQEEPPPEEEPPPPPPPEEPEV